MKKGKSNFTAKLQYFGGAMMIPIIILVVCGFCMGIGSPFANFIFPQGSIPWVFASLLMRIGSMIMSNIPIWFTVGIAFGLARQNKGYAGLAALFMMFATNTVISTLLSLQGITPATCNVEGIMAALGQTAEQAEVTMNMYKTVGGIFTYDMSIFISLICGGLTGFLMNKYGNKKLPDMFSFFAGAKFVVLITPLVAIVIGIILFYFWPFVNTGIQSLATFIANSGLVGTFVHRVIDRALLPFGMHHLINFPLFYSPLGGSAIVDGVEYFGTVQIRNALVASKDATSLLIRNYSQGKAIINIAGWSGAMLAMYHTARKENRKKMLSMMIPALFTSAFVGVTEPMEFTVLFANPLLYYLVHVPLAGLAAVLSEATAVSMQGDAILFMISNILQPQKVHAMSLLWIMPLFFALYYFIFKWLILKFNVQTPGRGEAKDVRLASKDEIKARQKGEANTSTANLSNDEIFAQNIIDCFGGPDNIISVENCATRLRVGVKDASLVAPKDFWVNSLGAMGVVENDTNYQIIFGPKVINICADVKKALGW